MHQNKQIKTLTSKEASERLRKFSGAKETRTPDPLHAMQVLYQLSYGPKNADKVLNLPLSCRSLQRQRSPRTLRDICAYICRHTAASLPCTCT